MRHLPLILTVVIVLTPSSSWADCRQDFQQAMQVVNWMGQNPQAPKTGAERQLEMLMQRLEAGGCTSQMNQIYQAVQQRGF